MECVKDLRSNRCGQVTAYDLDVPENSRIMYSIIGKYPAMVSLFSLCRLSMRVLYCNELFLYKDWDTVGIELFCPFLSIEISFPIVVPDSMAALNTFIIA